MARVFGLLLWLLLNMTCTVLPLIVLMGGDDRGDAIQVISVFLLLVVVWSWGGLVAYLLHM